MPVGYSLYRPSTSIVHNGIDPRTKLLWLGSIFVAALCFNDPLYLGGLMVALGAIAFWAKLGWRDLRGFVFLAAWLLTLSAVVWPAYFSEGTPLFDVGPVTVTSTGLLFGIAMGLRISLMVLAASIWMLTTSPQRITSGLLGLGMPYKAGITLSSTIRFIPLMNAERATIVEAQRARGLDVTAGSPVKRLFRAAPVLVPLFSRAFMTAQNLTVAMDARGFGVSDHRTNVTELEFTSFDRVLCLLALVLVVGAILFRILGIGVLIPDML